MVFLRHMDPSYRHAVDPSRWGQTLSTGPSPRAPRATPDAGDSHPGPERSRTPTRRLFRSETGPREPWRDTPRRPGTAADSFALYSSRPAAGTDRLRGSGRPPPPRERPHAWSGTPSPGLGRAPRVRPGRARPPRAARARA